MVSRYETEREKKALRILVSESHGSHEINGIGLTTLHTTEKERTRERSLN